MQILVSHSISPEELQIAKRNLEIQKFHLRACNLTKQSKGNLKAISHKQCHKAKESLFTHQARHPILGNDKIV